jgi:hypothetical protein
LVNGDFEKNLSHWSNWGGTKIVTQHNSLTARIAKDGGFSQDFEFSYNKKYKLKFSASRSHSQVQMGCGLISFNAKNEKLNDKSVSIDSNSLKQYDLEFTVDRAAVKVGIYCYRWAGTSRQHAYVDDLTLIESGSLTPDVSYYNLGRKGNILYRGESYQALPEEFIDGWSNTYTNINSSDEEFFQTGRYAKSLKLAIPVENGVYTVLTYHHENYFGFNNVEGGPAKRKFDIFIEGVLVLKDLDLFHENNNQELLLKFEDIKVTDGLLNIDMSASINNATASGFTLIKKK